MKENDSIATDAFFQNKLSLQYISKKIYDIFFNSFPDKDNDFKNILIKFYTLNSNV